MTQVLSSRGTISFRWAHRADHARIVELVCAAYEVERTFVTGPRTDLEEIAAHQSRGEFLLAEDDDGVVGSMFLEERAASAGPTRRLGYFGLLAVDPSCQGLGIGRTLVERAEQWTRERGLEELEIWTVNLRKRLRSWYVGMGYVEVAKAPFEAQERKIRPCHFVILRKTLS